MELRDFNIEEYKEEMSVYKKYTDKIDDLEKKKESLYPSFLGTYLISLVLIFIIIISPEEGLGEIFSSIILTLLIFSFPIAFIFHGIFCADFFTNIFSLGKTNELKKQISEIEELRNNSYTRLLPFEKIISSYFDNQLKEFFEDNLYKKRSGNQKFEESLSEFLSIIEEAKNINLVTTNLYLSEYEKYVLKRSVDHDFQKLKKTTKLDPMSTLARDLSKVTAQEPKEIVVPEKHYRIARKIDNWDEINKKRRLTGLEGEEIVVVLEQEFLKSISRDDLSQKVSHVSVKEGDGLGYDVLSFFEDGKEKYIEVKSTKISFSSPFSISRNELGFLKEHNEDSFIYHVLLSEDEPQIKVYSIKEFLEKNDLIPTQYIVKAK